MMLADKTVQYLNCDIKHLVTLFFMAGSLHRASFPPSRCTPKVAKTNMRTISNTDTWKKEELCCMFCCTYDLKLYNNSEQKNCYKVNTLTSHRLHTDSVVNCFTRIHLLTYMIFFCRNNKLKIWYLVNASTK